MIQPYPISSSSLLDLPPSMSAWRSGLRAEGALPVVAIAGSRGKSTVVRIVDAIFRHAGLRTALWTDQGVETEGRRQRGELVPWSRALERLRSGTLDVAIQELDWATVNAVGLPPRTYPVVAVTNLCINSEACLAAADADRAIRALAVVRSATRDDGLLVLNGEDFAVAGQDDLSSPTAILVGLSRDTPLVQAHRRRGGVAAWTQDERFEFGTETAVAAMGRTDRFPLALGGSVAFQLHNALMAAATALSCGVSPPVIETALSGIVLPTSKLPGSFNILSRDRTAIVVDRPAPSWFLRPALRAISHMRVGRVLTVAGTFPEAPEWDLYEIGRLLGRNAGALILHDRNRSSQRMAQLRAGIALNDVPPVVVHVRDERSAVGRALSMARPDDLLLVLADHPANVLRMMER